MSLLAYNSNNKINKSGILFYGKKLYSEQVKKQYGADFIDLWYSKPLYGKVDSDFLPMFPLSTDVRELNVRQLPLKEPGNKIKVNDGGRGKVYALNFVADAFNAMNQYFRDLEVKKKIVPGSFFHPLEAHKGWEGTNGLYENHIRSLYDMFVNKYLLANQGKLHRQIKNFDNYLPIFINFINKITEQGIPLTKSGFITSTFCPHSTSGLVIEIAKEKDKSDDAKKLFGYFSDSQIQTYFDVVKKFGFYVDINIPWRLVANLTSNAWQNNDKLVQIIDRYFPDGYSVDSVFENYYYFPEETDLESLKTFALEFYNSFINQEPLVITSKVCDDRVLSRKTTRRQVAMGELQRKYNDLFWIHFYYQLRLREAQINTTRHRVKSELTEINNIYYSSGTETTIANITDRMAAHMKEQVEKFISLKEEEKNLLTAGKAPIIMF